MFQYLTISRYFDKETMHFSSSVNILRMPVDTERCTIPLPRHGTSLFNQLHRQDPLAAKYLLFMVCIDHVNIPQSLLASSCETGILCLAYGL